MTTCEWPTTPLYQDYHDYEWGRPIHDDQHQFEHICLESLQCGLSWLTILNKRDIIRECFDHFDIDAVAAYGESDIERIICSLPARQRPALQTGYCFSIWIVTHPGSHFPAKRTFRCSSA